MSTPLPPPPPPPPPPGPVYEPWSGSPSPELVFRLNICQIVKYDQRSLVWKEITPALSKHIGPQLAKQHRKACAHVRVNRTGDGCPTDSYPTYQRVHRTQMVCIGQPSNSCMGSLRSQCEEYSYAVPRIEALRDVHHVEHKNRGLNHRRTPGEMTSQNRQGGRQSTTAFRIINPELFIKPVSMELHLAPAIRMIDPPLLQSFQNKVVMAFGVIAISGCILYLGYMNLKDGKQAVSEPIETGSFKTKWDWERQKLDAQMIDNMKNNTLCHSLNNQVGSVALKQCFEQLSNTWICPLGQLEAQCCFTYLHNITISWGTTCIHSMPLWLQELLPHSTPSISFIQGWPPWGEAFWPPVSILFQSSFQMKSLGVLIEKFFWLLRGTIRAWFKLLSTPKRDQKTEAYRTGNACV